MRVLYGFPISANTHRVRVLLRMLNLEFQEVTIDIPGGEHKSPKFLEINPLGQVPVLVDGEVVLRDSHAIMVYLARRYGGERFLPNTPVDQARVLQWLFFSANEMQNGPHMARLHHLLGVPMDIDAVTTQARAALQRIEDQLSGRDWLEFGFPTLADLACFVQAGVAPEAKIALDVYPNIRAWIGRIKALPGYVGMPGL